MRSLAVVKSFSAIMVVGMLVLSGARVSAATDAELAAKAEALIAPMVKADRFSGAVLVARDGKPVFRKGFGLANREWNIPNDPETKFRIGSITKQFTATAILQLQEAGKLSVDDPVSKYYPDAPAGWNCITIKHLLTHTSGIPSYTDAPHFFDQGGRSDRTPEEIVKLMVDKPLQFAPGSQYAYDNGGYAILGYIVEKVSGERYADYLQHHIFDPLGMSSTGYDVSERVVPKRAAGYRMDKGSVVNAPYFAMSEAFSAGGLYSTVDDLLIWDQALYAGKPLKPDSMQAMFTDYGHGYGFGWMFGELAGHKLFFHPGLINGFTTNFGRYTKDRLTMVVFSNVEGAPVGGIGEELAALYLGNTGTDGGSGRAMPYCGVPLMRRGRAKPNYDELGPKLAEATKAQLPDLQKTFAGLGELKSIKLQYAYPGGDDTYTVVFENGVTYWDVTVKDGKLVDASF